VEIPTGNYEDFDLWLIDLTTIIGILKEGYPLRVLLGKYDKEIRFEILVVKCDESNYSLKFTESNPEEYFLGIHKGKCAIVKTGKKTFLNGDLKNKFNITQDVSDILKGFLERIE